MTTETTTKTNCRRVDGLPGTPCKTCGRIVIRRGTGRSGYHLTHAKPGDRVVRFPDATTGYAGNNGDDEVAIPAGEVGIIIKDINNDTLWVKVVGRSLLVSTDDIDELSTETAPVVDKLAALDDASWRPERIVSQSSYVRGVCENCTDPIQPGERHRSRSWRNGPATIDAHIVCPKDAVVLDEVDHDLCDRDAHLRRQAAGQDCPMLTEPEVVARCGQTHVHGAHPYLVDGQTTWCAGNGDVVTAVERHDLGVLVSIPELYVDEHDAVVAAIRTAVDAALAGIPHNISVIR